VAPDASVFVACAPSEMRRTARLPLPSDHATRPLLEIAGRCSLPPGVFVRSDGGLASTGPLSATDDCVVITGMLFRSREYRTRLVANAAVSTTWTVFVPVGTVRALMNWPI